MKYKEYTYTLNNIDSILYELLKMEVLEPRTKHANIIYLYLLKLESDE